MYTVSSEDAKNEPNTVTFYSSGQEMLRFNDKGFYVRGVRVNTGDDEPIRVYQAFREWLAWQHLTRE